MTLEEILNQKILLAETILQLEERIDAINVQVPYFQQAAQIVLFKKENNQSYPNTMNALRSTDDQLIASNSYDGLLEGSKAQLLSNTVIKNLGI